MAQIYKKSVLSDISLVRDEVESILLFVCQKIPNIEQSDLLDLKLIFSELLYNAVIHGNNQDIDKQIDIVVEISQDTISGQIKDYGNGFEFKDAIHLSTSEHDLTKEHGRGIRIVQSLCQVVTFEENGTQVSFSKRVTNYS